MAADRQDDLAIRRVPNAIDWQMMPVAVPAAKSMVP
jgi:hypothetical protein